VGKLGGDGEFPSQTQPAIGEIEGPSIRPEFWPHKNRAVTASPCRRSSPQVTLKTTSDQVIPAAITAAIPCERMMFCVTCGVARLLADLAARTASQCGG